MGGPSHFILDVDLDREKTAEFAKSAFTDARAEIALRIQMRERLELAYITGSVGLFGSILVAYRLIGDFPISLFILSPVFSFIVAIQNSSHLLIIERLAEYIRRDLNLVLLRVGAWAPYWDFHTRHLHAEVEATKSKLRRIATLFTIHSPSFIAVISYTYLYITDVWLNQAIEDHIIYTKGAIFCSGISLFLYAIYISYNSYNIRKETAQIPIFQPRWYAEICEELRRGVSFSSYDNAAELKRTDQNEESTE